MHLLRVSVVRVQKLMLQVQRQLLLLTSRGWGGILSSRPYVHRINKCNVCTYNVILITRLIVRPTARKHTHPRGANGPTGDPDSRSTLSDGRICDPPAAAGLRAPAHRGARDDGPGALDHRDHATDIRPRVCAGQILRGAVRQQVEDRRQDRRPF